MKIDSSNTKAGEQVSQDLASLPDITEVHIALSENVIFEVELLDRLLGQEIIDLFVSDQN